ASRCCPSFSVARGSPWASSSAYCPAGRSESRWSCWRFMPRSARARRVSGCSSSFCWPIWCPCWAAPSATPPSNRAMRAMVLRQPGSALQLEQRAVPAPGAGQLRVRISACAVCRTDLHVVDGELPDPTLPIVPGHEIVGVIDAIGEGAATAAAAGGDKVWHIGQRVGIPWLGYACGRCEYCRRGQENLCDFARFTGYQLDGGYADYTLADARFCLPLPAALDDEHTAPLLCAGLIGYRCLVKAGDARRLGLYGFGAAAHLIAQVARHQGREVYGFVRPGDMQGAAFARSLGARWVGASDELPPEPLDAAILFAPVGELVP